MSNLNTLIVASIPIRKVEDIAKIFYSLDADLIELRVDYMENPLSIDYNILPKGKVVVTLRDFDEGGARFHDPQIKVSLYRNLWDKNIIYDVELAFLEKYDVPYENCIVSIHIFRNPPQLDGLCQRIIRYIEKAFAVKIAVKPFPGYRSYLMKLLELGNKIAVMPMDTSPIERIGFSLLGSRLIYGYVDEPTAPGQLHYKKIREILNTISKIATDNS